MSDKSNLDYEEWCKLTSWFFANGLPMLTPKKGTIVDNLISHLDSIVAERNALRAELATIKGAADVKKDDHNCGFFSWHRFGIHYKKVRDNES